MGGLLYIVVRVLLLVLVVSIPLWIVTRRSRAEFRRRFGRTPTDAELDDLGAWLKDPADEYAARRQPRQPTQQQQSQPTEPHQAPAAQTTPRTSFGADTRASGADARERLLGD